jgi:dienelactone hydrolase
MFLGGTFAVVVGVLVEEVGVRAAGPYQTTHKSFKYDALDISNRHIDTVAPVAPNGSVFPLIAFAHGLDDSEFDVYSALFEDLASWGYVVAAPLACKYGCLGDCKIELGDPPCFGHYYKQQLKTIEWTRTAAAASLPINTSAGVGVAGHSMGGQASLFSAAYNASGYNIRAVSLLHAFTHKYPRLSVPFLVFTGTEDDVASPSMAQSIFDRAQTGGGAPSARGFVNKVGANHHEPSTEYNPKLGLYTVAWFKLHLDGLTASQGQDWDALVYGNGSTSLCGGGDGAMKACELHRGA